MSGVNYYNSHKANIERVKAEALYRRGKVLIVNNWGDEGLTYYTDGCHIVGCNDSIVKEIGFNPDEYNINYINCLAKPKLNYEVVPYHLEEITSRKKYIYFKDASGKSKDYIIINRAYLQNIYVNKSTRFYCEVVKEIAPIYVVTDELIVGMIIPVRH